MLLKIGNSDIPLFPGISLPLVLRSPLFSTSESKIPGSYIFNSSFPATETLRREFGQAHRIQRNGRATAELPYQISSGSLRFQGSCNVTEANADQYEIAFKVDNGDLAAKLKAKTLKDLNLGGDQVIAALHSEATSENFFLGEYNPNNTVYMNSNAPETILMDLTNSMTDGGKTFTAPRNIICKQVISLSAGFYSGTLTVKAAKNGIGYIHEIYASEGQVSDIITELNLIAGDVVTVELTAESYSLYPDGHDLNIWIGHFRVEYSSPDVFSASTGLDQYSSDFAIFPIHNKDFLSNFPDDIYPLDNLSLKTIYTEYFPILNYYKDGSFPLYLNGTSEGESFVCGNLFTPFVYLNTILLKIAGEAGYRVVNNPFDADFKGAVLFNSYAENTYANNSTTLVPVKSTFNLSDHVPAVPQSDFLSWISALTGSVPLVDNNACTITFVDLRSRHIVSNDNQNAAFPGILLPNPKVRIEPEYAGIKFELKRAGADNYLGRIKELSDKFKYIGEVDDPRNLPVNGTVNDMYYVRLNNAYYVYQYNPETYSLTYYFHTENFPLIYTEGVEPFLTVTTELCPILTKRMIDDSLSAPFARLLKLPRTEQAGTLEGFPDSFGSEAGLQVLYYKGMSLDSLGQQYPFASCRYDDYPGNLPFFPDFNAESLFNHRYKEFLKWLAYDTKPVTFKAILTAGQMKRIKFDQIYSGNGFMFLIKEIRVNMEIDGLSMAEMDVYTC
jgi:hypothetical protein